MSGKRIAALLSAIGAGVLVTGVAMIFPPAALITAGILLLALGLVPDWGA